MNKLLKTFAVFLCASVIASIFISPAASAVNGEYGAGAVEGDKTYTIEEMLTHAAQDKFLSMARYAAYINKFGDSRPLSNISGTERAHSALLISMLRRFGYPVPENIASKYIEIPGTLMEAYKRCLEDEKKTIEMYNIFLRHELPGDVKAIFTVLRTAATNHRRALERAIVRYERNRI